MKAFELHPSTILVTGGAGMIGSNLVKRLVGLGHRVRVVDDLSRGRAEHLLDESGRPVIDIARDLHVLDLSRPGVLDAALSEVDYVYHLADVVGGIAYVFAHQGWVFRQNLLINTHVVDALRRHARTLQGYVYVGTACSFPAHKQTHAYNRPLRETDQYPAAPESAYGWSKLMGEYEALLLERESGLPVAVLSLHNVYGAPSDVDAGTSQVIPALICKAVCWPAEDFVVWGSGLQGRAFVHVDDVIDALVAAIPAAFGQGVIQIGPAACTSIRELAETIVTISGKGMPLRFDTGQPEGDAWRYADYARARELLGWQPRIGLNDGLRRLYQWVESRIIVPVCAAQQR